MLKVFPAFLHIFFYFLESPKAAVIDLKDLLAVLQTLLPSAVLSNTATARVHAQENLT